MPSCTDCPDFDQCRHYHPYSEAHLGPDEPGHLDTAEGEAGRTSAAADTLVADSDPAASCQVAVGSSCRWVAADTSLAVAVGPWEEGFAMVVVIHLVARS